jgi:hypothetical protein
MKKSLFALIILSFFLITNSYAQGKSELPPLGPNPVYFIDSVRVQNLSNLNPQDLAMVTVYTDKDATDIVGDEGKDGLVYMETKIFAKRRYWRYFKSKSADYEKIVPNPESDTTVQYIINNNIQKASGIGNLASINDKLFKSIQIIDKATLIEDYGIEDKLYGVIIISDVPPTLLGGKDKF